MSYPKARPAKSAPLKTDPRFKPTKTGQVGLQRESMLRNELHFLVTDPSKILIYLHNGLFNNKIFLFN
jgi:hypothetical protein